MCSMILPTLIELYLLACDNCLFWAGSENEDQKDQCNQLIYFCVEPNSSDVIWANRNAGTR